jgi:hypothetical protein
VKNEKENDLFDSGSEINSIYKSLPCELSLEIHDLGQPCSLWWIQEKSSTRITIRCKIKFSINIMSKWFVKKCLVAYL